MTQGTKCLDSAENRKIQQFKILQRTERAGYKKIKKEKERMVEADGSNGFGIETKILT